MARVAGKNGRLYVGLASTTAAAECVAFIKSWDIDFKTDRYDATAQGDSNHVYVAGLPDASGKFDGFYDASTVQTYTAASDGNARRTYWYPDAVNTPGQYWMGTAFWDFSVSSPVDGVGTISGTSSPSSTLTKIG